MMMNIRQIVRLRQLLRRWQTRAHRRRSDSSPSSTVPVTVTSCIPSPRPRAADGRRARAFSDADETDDDGVPFRRPATPPADVPEGYLAVYVGTSDGERRRYVIPMEHLNRPWFRELLDRAAEEFGFQHAGGLTIPVDVATFERILVQETAVPVPVTAFEPLRRHRAAVSV